MGKIVYRPEAAHRHNFGADNHDLDRLEVGTIGLCDCGVIAEVKNYEYGHCWAIPYTKRSERKLRRKVTENG